VVEVGSGVEELVIAEGCARVGDAVGDTVACMDVPHAVTKNKNVNTSTGNWNLMTKNLCIVFLL